MRVLVWIGALFLSFAATAANACSCNLPQTVEEHIARSEVIFIGAPVGTRATLVGLRSDNPDRLTRFRVRESMKGVEGDIVSIFHDKHLSGNCGLDFEKGHTYFVFASPDESGRLVTSDCALTRALNKYEPETIDAYRDALSVN